MVCLIFTFIASLSKQWIVPPACARQQPKTTASNKNAQIKTKTNNSWRRRANGKLTKQKHMHTQPYQIASNEGPIFRNKFGEFGFFVFIYFTFA